MWSVLLRKLERLQRSDYCRKSDAREKWDKLKYVKGQDIYDYHTSWDDVLQDMRENHTLPDEETLIFDYKRKMDAAAVLHMQRGDRPDTSDGWKKCVEEFFDSCGYRFSVLEASDTRVDRVRIRRLGAQGMDGAHPQARSA